MKYYKYKMDITLMNVIVTLFTCFLLIIYYLIFNVPDITIMTIIYIILWMFLHELIHGIAFSSFNTVNKKNIVYGVKLESGIFYCMCKQSIDKKIILTALLSPFFYIGILTLIISVIFKLPILGLLSIFNISGAIGDILMAIMFLHLPKDIGYTDLDDCEGFVVLSKSDLSKNKYWGFELIDIGDYTDDIKPKNFKKFTCSKISYIIFTVILIMIIIDII